MGNKAESENCTSNIVEAVNVLNNVKWESIENEESEMTLLLF